LSIHPLSCLALAACLAAPAPLAAQGYTLHAGDLVIADTSEQGWPGFGRVLVLHEDGSLETIASGQPLYHPTDVGVDRDGAVLVSCWQSQASIYNGIYRVDPATGAVTILNQGILEDDFQFCRDGQGDLVVADGYGGLKRILADGTVLLLSAPSFGFDTNIGLVLAPDHSLLVSEAPNYLQGSSSPGYIHQVDPVTGYRQVVASDPAILPNPNGLAWSAEGILLATDAIDTPSQVRHGLVGRNQAGRLAQVAWNGLAYPTDVEVVGPGLTVLADPGLEAVLLRLPDGTLKTILSEADDGDPLNGLPVDRPFGLARVPVPWLRTPMEVTVGATFQVQVAAPRALAGSSVEVALALEAGPSPLSRWWPGDTRYAHLDLQQAIRKQGTLDTAGQVTLQLQVPNDPNLVGDALQLQVFHPGARLVGNHVALPVR